MPLFAQSVPTLTPGENEARDYRAVKLRRLIEASPKLPFEQTDLVIKLPKGQELGMVSWLAHDAKTGVTWLIQRGDKADPVMAVDKDGRVLRSFGKGMYKIPHTIRLDPEGNVWTVDAGSSTVIKFSPKGKKLLQIDVGGQPDPAMGPLRGVFLGTTDIAFASRGRIFISDGYANARILEYTADGRKVREGAVRAPVRASSICRTPSCRMRTTSSMLLTARMGGLRNSTSSESSWARFQTWVERIR
jgi:hypothetical protein